MVILMIACSRISPHSPLVVQKYGGASNGAQCLAVLRKFCCKGGVVGGGAADVDQLLGDAGDGTLAAGPWGPCTASCGKGWQERSLVCATSPALLGEVWECKDPLKTIVSRRCG